MTHKMEDELRRLIADFFGGDLVQAAAAISCARGKRASVRTVQAWLAPDDHPSKRKCPPDAIVALKRAVSDPGFRKSRPAISDRLGPTNPIPPPARTAAVRWSEVKLAELPRCLEELERLHREEMDRTDVLVELLFAAIRASRDYDELRATLAELREQYADARWNSDVSREHRRE